MSTILECANLTKRYGARLALDNISLKLESGRIIGKLFLGYIVFVSQFP